MSTDLMTLALRLTANDQAGLDLTDAVHLNRTHEVADALLATGADEFQLRGLEADLIADSSETPLLLHVAAKMAVSRRNVLDLQEPAHLSVVFAVYKEHQRILPPDKTAGGEDFLVRKAAQLEWLFAGREDLTWDMIVVDDGCPEGSGRIAKDIAKAHRLSDRIQVLFLRGHCRGSSGNPSLDHCGRQSQRGIRCPGHVDRLGDRQKQPRHLFHRRRSVDSSGPDGTVDGGDP